MYLGRTRNPRAVVATNMAPVAFHGRHASDAVQFGDSTLTLVVSPNGPLGGSFFESLPWIIAIAGALIAIAAALVTDRLVHGRRYAEQLAVDLNRVASENRLMYAEQRGIAQALQDALLPDSLPEIAGLDVSARYIPATSGIDVGGDWYDVVTIDDGRVLLMLGDVAGHGLRAATTMASMRHAALAYAAQDPRPATVLSRLSAFASTSLDGQFATVLCVLIDVHARSLTSASAGHLPPLLIDGGQGRFLDVALNAPIGVASRAPYSELTISVAAGTTLLAFTDGLVERHGEIIDVGLERLRRAASHAEPTLEELISNLTAELEHRDDAAIIGIRWQT